MDILSDVNVNGKIVSNDAKVYNSICADSFYGCYAGFECLNVDRIFVSSDMNSKNANIDDLISSKCANIKNMISTCRLEANEIMISKFMISGKMQVPTYSNRISSSTMKNHYFKYRTFCLLVPQGCNRFYLNDTDDAAFSEEGTIFTNILDSDSGKYVYMDIQRVLFCGEYYDFVASRSDLDEKIYLIKNLELNFN